MGDNVLEGQVNNARKRRDRAMAEMQLPPLFSRPEIVRQVFTVKPAEGITLQAGETLLAVRIDGQLDIGITRDYSRIGTIGGDGAKVLGQALADTSGVATLVVREVLGLSGLGKAEVVKE
jgi:hypothetical protein